MRAHTVALPIAIGSILLAAGLAGCSSSDEAESTARQAAADLPYSGVAICLQNETSSRFGGTSVNTREEDRDIFVGNGETGCAWWKGASQPKLILQGPIGSDFEIRKNGNSSISVCGTSFSLPFDSGPAETESKNVTCSGTPYVGQLVLTKESGEKYTRLIAVLRDS